jgi:hypothetical protein
MRTLAVLFPALLAAALLSAGPQPARAATTPGEMKDVALRLKTTGTVVALDPAARKLTLKGQRGQATYRLDPKVTNLAQVQVGDRVRIDYVAALVLTLRRAGKEETAPAAPQPAAAPAADGVVATGTTVVTKVLAVDRKAQSVRLRGPEGREADFRVKDPADLVGVRVGDRVVAVLHEAVVVGLEPVSR